jgi:hypothetical protein
MRLARGGATVIVACALSACGANGRAAVEAKLQQFVSATAAGDYRTLCQDVLAQSLIARLASTGHICQQSMQIFLQSVQDPTLSVGKVTVRGHDATALTLTTARGQRSTVASVELVETSNGWRLSALGPSGGGSG